MKRLPAFPTFLMLIFLATPSRWIYPHFEADDFHYLKYASTHSFWEVLLLPKLGYFSLVGNAMFAMGSFVPYELLPVIKPVLIAGIAWMICKSIKLPHNEKLILLAAIALFPMGMWQLLGQQFYIAIAVFMSLDTKQKGSMWIAAFGALNGALSSLLWPVAILRGRYWEAAILGGGFIFQGAIAVFGLSEINVYSGMRHGSVNYAVMAAIWGISLLSRDRAVMLAVSIMVAAACVFAINDGPRYYLLPVIFTLYGLLKANWRTASLQPHVF